MHGCEFRPVRAVYRILTGANSALLIGAPWGHHRISGLHEHFSAIWGRTASAPAPQVCWSPCFDMATPSLRCAGQESVPSGWPVVVRESPRRASMANPGYGKSERRNDWLQPAQLNKNRYVSPHRAAKPAFFRMFQDWSKDFSARRCLHESTTKFTRRPEEAVMAFRLRPGRFLREHPGRLLQIECP